MEEELYNKSKILYGLFFAKNTIIKYDNCYLVEGYTDVISMHQSGVENVVASSGTSLTVDQIKLIKRYSDNVTILYDGDAAGIRASFRGIDMILSEGMNVKVVLFPDGDDPDSFAKKSTTEELKTYIETNAKDFIVFKSDVLLADAGNDPLKKAQLINDIVNSIAVIEDAIKRQIYIKECTKIFDFEEQTITNEVNKARQKNKQNSQRSYPSQRTPDNGTAKVNKPVVSLSADEIPLEAMIPPEYLDAQPTTSVKPKDDFLYYYELDVIRILLNYAVYSVRTTSIEVDENGKEKETAVEVSVVELITHEINKDEMSFENETFNAIYNEYCAGLAEGILYNSERFTRHENSDISSVAADLVAPKYEISANWSTLKVRINTEIDNLDRAVLETIYAFKQAVVITRIKAIQSEINRLNEVDTQENIDQIMDLMIEHSKLDKVKLLLLDKLGRTII